MMIGRHDGWLVTTILNWEWERMPWYFFSSCYFYSGGWVGRGSVTFQTSLQYTVHARLVDLYCLTNNFLILFAFFFRQWYLPSLSTTFIRHFYQPSLSTIFIRNLYLPFLSTIFIYHFYPPSLSTIFIRHLFPSSLSTVFSAIFIRNLYLPFLFAIFILYPSFLSAIMNLHQLSISVKFTLCPPYLSTIFIYHLYPPSLTEIFL